VDKNHLVLYTRSDKKEAAMAELNKSGDSGAYLGPGTKVNGKLHFDGPATIEGDIEGEIVAHASVTIGQQATMKGKISAVSVVVQGKVLAEIQAEKKLEIQSPGSVIGDVNAQTLVIGDGAVLEGHVSMRKEGRVLPLRQDVKSAAKETSSTQS
jgi:cytoskeletal protein CcmA (bactofilin family)